MEIAKENYFNVRYNRGRDVLEIPNDENKSVFKKHKFITGVVGVTLIFMGVNLYLIYKFFDILFAMGM